ncbi:STAS-like domain-containing protein [Agrobacterium rhizogenes]|nr:STAS-like domain-containing protein [Rhizobium rhizogenes]NTH70044.1 STAS-like domain-containing protein [Rhizobium rhizogenes]
MIIDVANQFNTYPVGRTPKDSTFNGERFRTELLVPALARASSMRPKGKVVVDIDGIRSFGSSFLEEAFGGLVRNGFYTRDELGSLLEIRCTKPHLLFFKQAIDAYIRDAKVEKLAAH